MLKKGKKHLFIFLVINIFLFILVIGTINLKFDFYISKIIKDIVYVPFNSISNKDELSLNINKEIEKENTQLKQLLKIKSSLSEFDIINATVVERNTAYWFNILTINKGHSDGIKKGMAVISNNAMIGIVDDTSNFTSTIRLLTSMGNNKISVRLRSGDDEIPYILSANEKGEMLIEGINKDLKIQVGDDVVTSGLSDIFPSGIFIGKVSSLKLDEYGISNTAYVSSLVDINNIRFVSVLSRGKING